MNNIKEDIVSFIIKFLQKYNIDPWYFFTIISIGIALSYRNVYKNWEKSEYWRKGFALSAAFGAIFFTTISILNFE